MPTNKQARLRLLLAVNTRELKSAFFYMLAAEPSIQIVATAATTAELLSYSRTLQPDGIVLEWELSGRPMADTYTKLTAIISPDSIFIINRPSSDRQVRELAEHAGRFEDPESLIHALEALRVSANL